MNDKIKELAKQAGDYVNEVYTPPVRSKTPGKIWEDGHIGWHEQFHEKFAELIVQECVGEIKHLRMKYDTHRDVEPEENDRYIDAFLQAEVRLKEYFGVEE